MTPIEAMNLGLIAPDAVPYVNFASFTSTDQTQNQQRRVTLGGTVYVDWGDGVVDWYAGTGGDVVMNHTYLSTGTYAQKWYISNPTLLRYVHSPSNALVGVVPSLTPYTTLQWYYLSSNQLSNYTASVLATTLTQFDVSANLLPQSAIDQILVDFDTNIAARPASGIINLGGAGNAAPSAVGLAAKAHIEAVKGAINWVITVNP